MFEEVGDEDERDENTTRSKRCKRERNGRKEKLSNRRRS
jgi:hypothetical protein